MAVRHPDAERVDEALSAAIPDFVEKSRLARAALEAVGMSSELFQNDFVKESFKLKLQIDLLERKVTEYKNKWVR